MGLLVPFRDINVHASASHYAFTSPSSPAAQTLVVERPSGDLRLNDGALLGAKRVSSIAGILGMIKLRLGQELPCHLYLSRSLANGPRQIHNRNHKSATHGPSERAYGL